MRIFVKSLCRRFVVFFFHLLFVLEFDVCLLDFVLLMATINIRGRYYS